MTPEAIGTSFETVQLLDGIVSDLAAVLDRQALAIAMDRIVNRIAPVERCALLFLDPTTGRLKIAYARGFDEAAQRSAEEMSSERNSGWVFRHRTMLHVPDIEHDDPSPVPTRPRTDARSKVHLPLLYRGDCVGVFALVSAEPHYFNEHRLACLSFVSNLAAIVYGNIRHTEELAEQLDLIRWQREELRVLSAPILDVGRGRLLLPLVGRVDSERAARIQEIVLTAVAERRASVVILDLTGMEAVDGAVLGAIAQIVRATRLMGARCAISGITPAMASSMVGLGIGFGDVDLFGTVERAIAQRESGPG